MARLPGEEARIRHLERVVLDNPGDASSHYELGKLHLAGEDFPAAIRVLEKAVHLNPQFHQASFELGCTYTRMRNFDSATRQWEKLTDIDGEITLENIDYSRQGLIRGNLTAWEAFEGGPEESIFKYYQLGVAHLVMGRPTQAVTHFSAVIAQNPAFEKALYYRSRCYMMLGRNREAGMDAKRLTQTRPRDPYGNYLLGMCLVEIGRMVDYERKPEALRTGDAIKAFHKALAEKPNYFKVLLQLAKLHFDQMQFDQAYEMARRAVPIKPDAGEVHLIMGRCLERQFRMDEAESCFEKAIAADPESKEAHFSLGLLYKGIGKHQSAVVHLQKTVELDPGESEAYYALGVLLMGLKKPLEALIPLRRCLELTPNHTYARYTLGKACLAVEQVDEAIDCFNLALLQNPSDVKTLTALGMAHFQKKQLEEAKKQFTEVLQRNPREAEAHYYLGATMFQMNDYDRAIESYLKASQVQGETVLSYFTNGALASYRRNYDQALTFFRKATELRPDTEADISRFATLQLLATVGITHAQQGMELKGFLDERKQLFQNFVRTLASFLDARDRYTRYHSWRVATIGAMLARHIGLRNDLVEGIEMGGLMHDVGKIGIPEHILNKPGKLTDEEYELIKRHPMIGWEGLKDVGFPWPQVLPIVRHHHEKWNGKGYPDGIGGDDIPFEAQIIGIADFFDALTTNRPYRAAFTYQKALDIMREESGKFFNPDLLEEFAAVADTNEFILELPSPAGLDESGNHILPSMEENWNQLSHKGDTRHRDSLSDSWGMQSSTRSQT